MLFCQIVAVARRGPSTPRRRPSSATVKRSAIRRTVYIDCLQNVDGKTLACAYSARASDYAGASTPLAWDELDDRLDPRAFTIRTLPGRLREVGDLWAACGGAGDRPGGGARARPARPRRDVGDAGRALGPGW